MELSALPTGDYWDESDWSQVFPRGGDWGSAYRGTFEVGPGGIPTDDVTAERIAEVVHWHADSPEGGGTLDFYAVVRLTDGQWGVSEAWADYTGWGCQDDAWWKVGPTYESALAELSEENRRRIKAA